MPSTRIRVRSRCREIRRWPYFAGYAMWTYLTTPFTLTRPGFRAEELEPWQEDGETWRRLRVEFPDDLTTHNKVQTFYFDADGLIRRHDYDAEVVAGGLAAHYSSAHCAVDGIVVPTKRRVHPVGEDGKPVLEPLLVSIDLSEIEFGEITFAWGTATGRAGAAAVIPRSPR
ncbi:hypothetical protein AB0383_26940 [Amycolatopsis sp. NPDC051373]|uniref:hypothetical protein n=1 Tax=Amycolatopsis sp. NPDC051373 TaxID=3155801 RepID=UPI00344C517B